jgi:hypothetical protein
MKHLLASIGSTIGPCFAVWEILGLSDTIPVVMNQLPFHGSHNDSALRHLAWLYY